MTAKEKRYICWLPEHDDLIRQRVLDGKSCRDICTELAVSFGIKPTRDSVIGRSHRIGCSNLRPASVKRPYTAPKRDKIIRLPRIKIPSVKASTRLTVKEPKPEQKVPEFKPEIVLPPREESFSPLPGTSPVMLIDLNLRTCRWPVSGVNEVASLFCGDRCVTGMSYCPTHRAMSLGRGTESERRAHSVVLA